MRSAYICEDKFFKFVQLPDLLASTKVTAASAHNMVIGRLPLGQANVMELNSRRATADR
jgi:hypothetical protein